MRIQSDGDLEAARFALLAWEDPDRTEGVTSPFWAETPMLDGELGHGARPRYATSRRTPRGRRKPSGPWRDFVV